MAEKGPVIVLSRATPKAVLVAPDEWNRIAARLKMLEAVQETVAVGPFSRKGKSRVETHASDHDFKPEVTITPVGILLPTTAELFVYAVASKVTSDCLIDKNTNPR